MYLLDFQYQRFPIYRNLFYLPSAACLLRFYIKNHGLRGASNLYHHRSPPIITGSLFMIRPKWHKPDALDVTGLRLQCLEIHERLFDELEGVSTAC